MPITIGLSITNNLPLQFSVNIRFLFAIFGDKDREGEWSIRNWQLAIIISPFTIDHSRI